MADDGPDVVALPLRNPRQRYGSVDAVVLADGEHYPPVVRDGIGALQREGWEIRGVVLLGGGEKLRGSSPDYGVPRLDVSLEEACRALTPSWFVDLSDEPVSVLQARMDLISLAATFGVGYVGPDLVCYPPVRRRVDVPVLAILGTGKRIGKTAVSCHTARLIDDVIVVAMGRGGPAEPVFVERRETPLRLADLLAISRRGEHAASDYLEDAVLSGAATVGCRRVGGGVVGAVADGNIVAGALLAAQRKPSLLLLEGSGAVTPPITADATILVGSTRRPEDLLTGFARYRLHGADLVLVVGIDGAEATTLANRVQTTLGDAARAIAVGLRPTPVDDIRGRDVAVFTTAPASVGALLRRAVHDAGATCVATSHHLAQRAALATDVRTALAAGADCFLCEIKASAIDFVAEQADAAGVTMVALDNRPFAHEAAEDLDALLADVAALARARFADGETHQHQG